MKIFIVLSKTILFYLVIFVLYRLIDKRKLFQLKLGDLAFLLFVFSIMMTGYDGNIILSLILVLLLVFLEFIVNKYVFINKSNKYSVIVDRGKINFGVMLRENYNLDMFISELRKRKIKSIIDIDYAILDGSCNLIVFTKENSSYPLPLIINGKIASDVLVQIGKDEEWLKKIIRDEGYLLNEVFYGFYKDEEVFLINNKLIK